MKVENTVNICAVAYIWGLGVIVKKRKTEMKHVIMTYIFTLTSSILYGQNSEAWTAFYNKDSTLIGYKDNLGIVRIEPKFKGFTTAKRFENIIAVSAENYNSYYLTKSGRIVGKDSLHVFDNGADCESEGFIRFRDKKTDKVGMFNRNGDIIIPAEYNDLTRVINGMVVGLKNGKKKIEGEHSRFIGGNVLLIDTTNRVLIGSFKYDDNIDFYSLEISNQLNTKENRQNFKTINGEYFSFIDYEKEFKSWLKSALLENFTKENLINASFKEIYIWKESEGWTSELKESYIEHNFELIKSKLLQLNNKGCDYNIFNEGLNFYIYDSLEFKDYFNDCGESKDWKYPIKNIVISYRNKKNLVQDQFEFLRTDNGYKLISLTTEK
ncbi:MAG: hypothetical protein PHR83_15145 [Paludibacter sp.]|nr:hypothetical protein [Paludibacter sp.]